MAGQTLTTGTAPRRRAFFGLLDAESWSWASLKAFGWFIVIILMLGYLPDRAYYFTVFSTIDLGLLGWSPVNLCPAENRTLPCPAPAGAVLPWEPSPVELKLPGPRTDGAAVVAGSKLIYVGGSATAGGPATADVSIATFQPNGTFSSWSAGPALPTPVKNAAVAFVSGSVIVLGGSDAAGKPTTTAYVATIDASTGSLSAWQKAADAKLSIDLPAARSGAAVAVAGDGVFLIGGSDANGPTTTVWKSTFDKTGKLGAWEPQAELVTGHPQTGATAVLLGNYLWVYGGSDANGPTGAVQRGVLGASGTPDAGKITQFGIRDGVNLPGARAGAAGFSSNGVLYLVGGSDGKDARSELYWTTPTSNGEITAWEHLVQTDLPAGGLVGSSAVTNGSEVFLVGGTTKDGVTDQSVRANMAPKEPYFQLGLFGATVPALKLEGEIGQQLGYLIAAGVGTVNFVILILIGWAFAHKERSRELLARFRRRG